MLFRKLVLLLLPIGILFSTPAMAQWDLPEAFPGDVEHGLQLMRNAELQAAMAELEQAQLERPAMRLAILHAKNPEQAALAAQLRDWLLTLGVNDEEMVLIPARRLKTNLRLQIQKP